MIQANELRIGNWIEVLGYVQIKNGNDIDIIIRGGEDGSNGIPLTPEILEKAKGWVSRPHLNDWFFKLQGTLTILIYTPPFKSFSICESNDEPCFIVDCEYLHNLQNIFFALTSTELEINH